MGDKDSDIFKDAVDGVRILDQDRVFPVPSSPQPIPKQSRLDDQDVLLHGPLSLSSAPGSSTRKVVPSPGVEVTWMLPPCCSAMEWAMDRPRPVRD